MGYRKKSWWDKTLAEVFFDVVFISLKTFQLIGEGVLLFGKNLVKLIVLTVKLLAISLHKTAVKLRKLRIPKVPKPQIRLKLPEVKIVKPKTLKFSFTFPAKIKIFLLGFLASTVVLTVPLFVFFSLKELPNPRMLALRSIPVTSKIHDRNGELLYEIYAEENRTPVKLSEIPEHIKQATISIEDKNFYRHQGISPRGILRALINIVFNKKIQGGSTITQQLIRSALLTPEVSLERKIKEIILSIWAERIYSKDQILEMYFNQVPYGGTAWGIEAAAQTYFAKSVHDLNLAEAALLAGLPAAPSRFSPFGTYPELAFVRQKQVLARMFEHSYITQEEKKAAEEEKLTFQRPKVGLRAPHFVMYVRELLAQKYGLRMVEQGGLRVITSLDLGLQNKIEEVVRQEIGNLLRLAVTNGAALITNPQTGEVLAMVGSVDYFDLENEGNVNVALTPQQPGSAIKAVTYTLALSNGFTAATILNDSPITYKFDGSPPYSPVNYDGRFHGFVPLRYALGNSYNVPAVRTLAKVGVANMIEQGRKMGIASWSEPSRYGLSLTLGGGEVTMLEMAQVYGTLANQGIRKETTPVLKVTDYLGNVLEDNIKREGERVVPEGVAFVLSDVLSDNKARTAAFGANSLLHIPGQWVPVKTGTSNEKRDNWTIGYTKDFVVVVWVGNNNNSPMHPTLTSGVTGATPIWRRVTDLLLEGKESRPPEMPPAIIKMSCRGEEEYFIKGTEPLGGCPPIPTPQPTLSPFPNP